MSTTINVRVPGVSCEHCRTAIHEEVSRVPGVEDVEVDLVTRTVVVRGDSPDGGAVRAAIALAGYDPE